MGRKIQLCQQIQLKMKEYADLTGEVQELISKCTANWTLFCVPIMGGQGHYEAARDKFGELYGKQMLERFKAMSDSLSDAEKGVRDLEDLLRRQKTNLFLKFSKHYRQAESFLAKIKPQLQALSDTEDKVRNVLTSREVPDACKMFFDSREW